jgi:transcriptional regulator with XRE-family HTH domain
MEKFRERLKKLIETEGLTASKFAEKIGTQRSSVSHVLSGRNKPSLDFVIKVTNAFKDITLDWLINGDPSEEVSKENSNKLTPTPSLPENLEKLSVNKKIKEIGFFFMDGTFKIFKN